MIKSEYAAHNAMIAIKSPFSQIPDLSSLIGKPAAKEEKKVPIPDRKKIEEPPLVGSNDVPIEFKPINSGSNFPTPAYGNVIPKEDPVPQPVVDEISPYNVTTVPGKIDKTFPIAAGTPNQVSFRVKNKSDKPLDEKTSVFQTDNL